MITLGLFTLIFMLLSLIFCCYLKGDFLFWKHRPAAKVKLVKQKLHLPAEETVLTKLASHRMLLHDSVHSVATERNDFERHEIVVEKEAKLLPIYEPRRNNVSFALKLQTIPIHQEVKLLLPSDNDKDLLLSALTEFDANKIAFQSESPEKMLESS
jgi:hypothetical protein